MKTSIFRRLLCMTIAAAMIFTGTVVLPVGEQYAYATEEEPKVEVYTGDTEFESGKGSADDPYIISTIDHLRNIKYHLKDAYYYELKNDLNFDEIIIRDEKGNEVKATYEEVYGDEWVAIGTDPDYFPFQGTFDGNGHTIFNLNFTSGATAGLFGYCAGTIKNLRVNNFTVRTTGQSAGALVGELCAGGRIEQCAVEGGRIASAHNVGGMAGVAWKGSTISNVYVDNVGIGVDYIYQANQAEDALLGGTEGTSLGNKSLDLLNSMFGAIEVVSSGLGLLSTIFGDDNVVSRIANGAKSFTNLLNNKITELRRTATIGGIVGFLGGDVKYSWARFNSSFWNSLSAGILGGFLSPYFGLIAGRNFYGTETGCLGVKDSGGGWEAWKKDHFGGKSLDVYLSQLYTFACKRLFKPVDLGRKGGDIDENGVWTKSTETQTDDSEIDFPRLSVFIDKEAKDANGNLLRNGNYNSSATAGIRNSAVEPKEGDDGVYKISTPFELAYIEYAGWNDYRLMNDIYLEDCGDPTHYKCTLDKQKTIGTVTVEGEKKPLYQRNCVDWGYWTPLCRERDQYFDGNFYGDGHTIYGLNVATNQEGGLFGFILGDVMDLNLVVTQVDAYASAGGLAAGVFYPGNIYRCSVTGKTAGSMVNGGGNADGSGVGGLVGIVGKDVTIQDCYSRIEVTNRNWVMRYEYDIAKLIFGGLVDPLEEVVSGIGSYKDVAADYKRKETRLNSLLGNDAFMVFEDLANRKDKLDSEIAELEEDNKAKKKTLEDTEKELKAAEESYNRELDNHKKLIEESRESDTAENKKKLTESEEMLKALNTQKDDLTNKKKELNDGISANDKKIDDKKSDSKKLGDNRDKLRTDIEDVKKNESDTRKKARKVAEVAAIVKSVLGVVKSLGSVGFEGALAAYENRLGGLVGDCRGKLINCYSTGKVTADSGDNGIADDLVKNLGFAGGLVGRVRNGDSWFSSDGKIMGVSEMVQNCYYSAYAGYGGAGTSLNQGGMVKKDSYIGFDFITVWAIDSNINGGLPYLNYDAYKAQAEKTAEDKAAVLGFAGGDGSEKNPFKIETVEQFTLISNFWYRDYYYILKNDLNLWVSGDLIMCNVGTETKSYPLGNFFKEAHDDYNGFRGHFDGDGHKIVYGSGKIDNTEGNVGLFPKVSGSVRNLELTGFKSYSPSEKSGYNKNMGILCYKLMPGGVLENIYIHDCAASGVVRIGGLAAIVEEDATAKNILIDNVTIYRGEHDVMLNESVSRSYYGDIAGLVVGDNSGTVEDIVINSSYINGDVENRGFHSDYADDQAAIHDNHGVAKRIFVNISYGSMTTSLTAYHWGTYGVEGTHHYYPGDCFATGEFGSETTFNGLDFNNTWMIMNNENLKLRCIRTTTVPDYEGKLSSDNIQGKGTKENPFIIDSVQDLIKVESKMTAARGFRGVYFKQNGNIDLSDRGNWTSIGTVEMPFGGNYDGNGFTITIKDKALFGVLDGAVVKNLDIKLKGTVKEGFETDTPGGKYKSTGILSNLAANSFIMNCTVKRDKNGNNGEDISVPDAGSGQSYGGSFAGMSQNTSFINCYSDAWILNNYQGTSSLPSLPSLVRIHTGGITGYFSYGENKYNGDIVGLPDTMAPVIANCVYNNNYIAENGKQKCNVLVGQYGDEANELLVNNSYIIPAESGISLNKLNSTEFVSDKLMERFYNWSIDENGILSLRPGICNVSINTSRDGISIVKAYKVLVQDSKETWEEIELEEPVRTLELSVKNGTRILLEVSFDADNVDKEKIRWELRDSTGRYVQTDDSGVELMNENVIEFSAERNLTVSIYDTCDRVADSLLVALPNNDITVSQYEPLTAENLQKKGVEFGKGYNYGYSDVISPTDSALNITPSYFENTGEDQEVTVTYTIDGNDVQKKFKVNVIPREMSGISVDTTAVAGTLDIEAYEPISAAALHEQGVRLYKTYNYGSPEDFNRADYGNITVIPNSIGTVGNNQQITLSYVSGEKTFAGSLNVNITDRTVSKIEVKNRPTKLQYVEGQSPEVSDLSGGIITVFYNNGPNDVIEMTPEAGVTIDSFNTNTVGTGSVTVKYGGKTASYPVTVVEKDVTSIEVKYLPTKTNYVLGEELDLTGGVLTFNYDNSTSANVSMQGQGITLSGYDSSRTGTQFVTLSYTNRKGEIKTTQFAVTVTDTADLNTSATGFVKKGDPGNAQSSNQGLLVQNKGNSGETKKTFIGFDLSQLLSLIRNKTLEIESAKLIYNAKVDQQHANLTKTVHLKGAAGSLWLQNGYDLTWNNAPIIEELINSSKISGSSFTKKTIDVTDYVNKCLLTRNNVAFAFEAGTCDQEYIIIGNTGADAPKLEIKLKQGKTVKSVTVNTLPKTRYALGEALDLTNGKLKITYADNSTAIVPMTAPGILVTDFTNNTLGEKTTRLLFTNIIGQRIYVSFNIMIDPLPLSAAQTGFVKKGEAGTVQSSSLGLLVKNNGTGGNTRKAYIKFNLAQLKTQLENAGFEIESAKLVYKARLDRQMSDSRTLYLKTAAEGTWIKGNLKWNNAPAISNTLNNTAISGNTFSEKTVDVTNYIKNRMATGAGSANTATFAFEASLCGGECIIVGESGANAPKLVITVKKKA